MRGVERDSIAVKSLVITACRWNRYGNSSPRIIGASTRCWSAAANAARPRSSPPTISSGAGILKHIGIEEKILLTAAARLRGAPLEQAARLRLDHGAIVSLLMPIPTPSIIRAIRTVLAAHNPIEEGDGGVYDICEKLAASEHDELLGENSRRARSPDPSECDHAANPRRGAPRARSSRLRSGVARRLASRSKVLARSDSLCG